MPLHTVNLLYGNSKGKNEGKLVLIRNKTFFFYIYFSLVMAVMGFHTIDNVHIDLDLILICQCSSEVKKLAQIAPVWSERLGAHPPHVFAALH